MGKRTKKDIRKDLNTGDNKCAKMMRKGVPGGEKHMNRRPEVGMGHMCTDKVQGNRPRKTF